MISLCLLVRDVDVEALINMFNSKCPCDYEVCIGDNSTQRKYTEKLLEIADEYIRIHDKQLFRMGLPWGHNLINSIANTYKIVYLDSDEFPIWINPNIENMLDLNYVLQTLRADFLTTEEIWKMWSTVEGYSEIISEIRGKYEISIQDRIYNSRYAEFNGLCHSVFHVPPHFRSNEAGAILLHNKTVRDEKDKKRMDRLIDEQFMRQNINPMLASSEVTLKWGKKISEHPFENFEEFKKAFD
ncbi:MAG: hypothetical protein GF364_19325 [Candidatus Lokiarchaeota archaeon]|nr:hypothetical protein [Candidatus Lokiarchaeota archaeon]